MDIKERITAMTSGLPALTIGHLVRYGADSSGRHSSSFEVRSGVERIAEVMIRASGEQAHVDEVALALHAMITGSEGRVADAEDRAANLRRALDKHKLTIADLRSQLAAFEVGRSGRGDMYAIEGNSGVWLCGKPDAAAYGLHFSSWGDLARAFPGLRPAGVRDGHVIMRPIGSME
jgi:hypothetical protein